MADAVLGKLTVNVAANTANFSKGLSKAKADLGGFEKSIGLAKSTIAALGVGFGVAQTVSFLKSSVDAAEEATAEQNKLAAVLKATGYAAGFSKEQLNEYATAIQKVTNFDDDAVAGAQAVLATFKEIKGQQFTDAINSILDISTVLGQDLKSSAVQVGKALNDPIRGMSALRRVGVSFTQDQIAMVQKMMDANDVIGAQSLILKELESEFGGAAKNVRSELKGLANDWGDLKEAIGGLFKTDAANAGFANMAANVRALSADLNALTEKTDRFRAANDERLAQKNAVSDAHQTALQIRRNVEEQQALLKKHAEVAARAEGRTFNRLGGFLDMRELNELSRQLNVLARERAALERLRNSQLGPLKSAKGFNIAEGAPEALKAGAAQAMGALDSLGKQLDKVFEVKGKGKEARIAFRGLAEAINHATGNGLLAELKEQADTWGMNARQIAIYKAQLKGVPPATLAAARALSKSIAQKEFDKAQTQREGERQQGLTDRFRELERETQTPQEELDAKLRQLDELRNADFGATKSGREVLDRAEAKFRKEFEESGHKSERKGEGNQALLANTSEAYSAIFRAPQNSIPNQQLKEQQKQTKSLGAIERKLGKGDLVVMVGKGAP